MALRAFLTALRCPQHEQVMLASGFDDVTAFANFDDDAVADMQKTLLAAGLPPGHVHEKIMRTVRACQDKELSGSSPVKFNYNKQMPLLETLRDEVRALKEQLRAACSKASEQELAWSTPRWRKSAKKPSDGCSAPARRRWSHATKLHRCTLHVCGCAPVKFGCMAPTPSSWSAASVQN